MKSKNLYATGFLIIAIAIFYYLVVFLPSQKNESDAALTEERRCYEAAVELHDRDARNLASDTSQMEPRYAFIKDEGVCLYKGGFISSQSLHEYIKNVYTNETISEHMSQAPETPGMTATTIYGDREDFEMLELKYFGSN